MQGGMLRRLERRDARRQQSFNVALDVEEIGTMRLALPPRIFGIAPGQTCHPHRLQDALDGAVSRGDGVVAYKDPAQLENARPRRLAVEVELQNLQQSTDQPKTHDAPLTAH